MEGPHNYHEDDIRLVPLTKQELEDLQLTLLGKMMQLSHDANNRKIPSQTIDQELEALGQMTEKVSRYYTGKQDYKTKQLLKRS